MAFQAFFDDGSSSEYMYEDLDVGAINRASISQFYLNEGDWFIGVDVNEGLFNFNGLVMPFAFHSSTTEFVLFRRMRFNTTPGLNVEATPQIQTVCFGLRNTLPDVEGVSRNAVQLIWVNNDGTVTIGGNK